MEFDAVFNEESQVLSIEAQESSQTLPVDFQESSDTITAAFDNNAELQADFGTFQTVSGGDVSASVTQTEDGAVIAITSNGAVSTATVLHGKDGQPGLDGSPGKDGSDGKDGVDGYTPIKGVDYFDGKDGLPGADGAPGKDGYTPQKGIDYFDGVDGKDGVDGQDGYTPIKGVDYFDGIDGQPGKDGVDGQDGYTPVKGVDYFDGEDGADGSPGADGISCTHEWSGTTLTITSASGTSSADLKGEPGSDGQPGSDGSPGADGYTPVKGTDYWTDADKAEIVDEFKQLTGIGTMYKGAWIAEETTGIGQRYTDYITIPPGTYIVSVVLPYASVGYGNKICIGFSASMAIGTGNTFLDAAYGCATMLATFTVTTNLCVISAASSNSATWGYLERGGIAAVRVG